METIHDWHGIKIVGLSAQYLNNAFGFEPAQFPAYEPLVTIGVDHPDRAHVSSETVELGNPFVKARLQSGRIAHLEFSQLVSRLEDEQFRLPLNAALTQHWLLSKHLAMHGALICLDGRGLLILGESLSGKSTLVQAALQLSEPVVTDDFLRIDFNNGWPLGHCLRGFLRFRAGIDQRAKIVPLRPDSTFFRSSHRIDGVIFLEGGERPMRSVFSAMPKLQATTLMVNQCAPFFLRREFPLERMEMLRLISDLLQRVPSLSVATGLDLLAGPVQFMAELKTRLWASR